MSLFIIGLPLEIELFGLYERIQIEEVSCSFIKFVLRVPFVYTRMIRNKPMDS